MQYRGCVPPKSSAMPLARVEGLYCLTRLFSLVSGRLFFPCCFLFFVAGCSCAPSFVLWLFPTLFPPKTLSRPRSLDALWSPTLFTLQWFYRFEHSILSFNP